MSRYHKMPYRMAQFGGGKMKSVLMSIQPALFSSNRMDWCTPQDFFDRLDAEFHFVLDAAATERSAKCRKYYTPETDGLKQSWDCGGGLYFAIHLTEEASENGCGRHMKNRGTVQRSFC